MPPRIVLKSLSGEKYAEALERIQRGDVLKVDLRGAEGGELERPHYCVVVSNDALNRKLGTVIVVPLTTHGGGGKPKPFEVELKAGDGGLEKDGYALPHQVRTIDKAARVTEIWGELSDDCMTEIEDQLAFAQGITFDDE